MRSLPALFFAASLLAAPAFGAPKKPPVTKTAPAATPDDVESVEQLFQKLEYEQANAAAQAVLKRKGLSYDELKRTLRVLAITYAVLDQEEAAKETFIKLLAVDPSYEGEANLGPRVNDPFLEARGYFRTQGQKPGLTVEPQVRTEGGTIRVVTKGPPRFVRKLAVGYRWGSSGAMNEKQLAASEGAFEVSKAPAGASRLDYYVFALDENDNTVMAKGSKEAPVAVFAEASKSTSSEAKSGRSIFASPWFWLITGVVVAGGAATGYYFLGPANVSAPSDAALRPTLSCGRSATGALQPCN